MMPCSNCRKPVDPTAPYCPYCHQARMTESLLAPRERPFWLLGCWNALAAAVVLVFLVTASVAFLRDAKAVRVARQDLSLHEPEHDAHAKTILTTFLEKRPEHEEALFLAAATNARLEKMDETAELRERLRDEEPDRLPELDEEVTQSIHTAFLAKGCTPQSVVRLYDDIEVLGDDYRAVVDDEVQSTIVRCVSSETEEEEQGGRVVLSEVVEREEDAKRPTEAYAERTFLQPIQAALKDGRFEVAERLAQAALSFPPQKTIDALLEGTRKRCEVSIERVDAACKAARASRTGRCFPESAPESVASAVDGWGRPLVYQPLGGDDSDACPRTFMVASFGADGLPSPSAEGTPDADLVCAFTGWNLTHRYPSDFWRLAGD